MPSLSESSRYLTPLVIGVTGHRDLLAVEIPALTAKVEALFAELRARFPYTPLRLMSALAEGADRLAAHAALGAGVELQVVLPLPAEEYRDDFASPESKAEFDLLCRCAEVVQLDGLIAEVGDAAEHDAREIAYATAGMFISAHCHVLLALWDGVQSDQVGGTAQIIYFQHFDRLPGISESVPRSSLFLTDDESDLVYHIACSRARQPPPGSPEFTPLEACWFTTDPDASRVAELPLRYQRVFSQTDEYNADALRILESTTLPVMEAPTTAAQAAAMPIGNYFEIADVLADRFQRRVELTLRALYSLAALAGLAFLLYSELAGLDPLIYVFLALLLGSLALARVARRREWHRKYLEYRVLAEGLRVQFYWAVAGIRGGGQTKFAYDNFLRQRDMDLGWIRNVMRVAGTRSDALPRTEDNRGLEFAVERWIGTTDRPGQLDYYRAKAQQRARINHVTDRLALACLWGGIMAAVALASFIDGIGDRLQNPLIILMGILPLVAGIAEAYSQRKASRELTKQYQFMARVFINAKRRIIEAADDAERREVLKGLGDAALNEHAEWILVHRERQPDSGQF